MRNTAKRRSIPAYPNAADAGYFLRKYLNAAAAVACGLGFSAAMALLAAMA